MTHLGDFFSSTHQQKLQQQQHADTFSGLNDTDFPIRLVTDPAELEAACRKLSVHPELALDLEFDDMRYFYGRTVSLVQVFDGDTVYLIDAVALKNIDPLLRILGDDKVVKIFHSCWNDLMVLREVYGCQVRNLLDTSVLYRLLGHSDNSISLKNLIKTYVDVDLEKGEQASNWIARPLSDSQVLYAAKDVIYLHQVTHLLQKELSELGRWHWAQEECKVLEKIKFSYEKAPYLRLAQKNRMYPHLLPRFADVWYFRENLAKKMNKPPFQLFPNDVLCELVRNPARTLEKWDTYRGIHPSLRKPTAIAHLEQLTATEMPLPSIPWREQESRNRAFERSMRDPKAWLREERKQVLKQLKKIIAGQVGLHVTNLFLSEKLQPDLADQGAEKGLKRWQAELIRETCEANGLDYSLIRFPLY